jgi:hypothetical protein
MQALQWKGVQRISNDIDGFVIVEIFPSASVPGYIHYSVYNVKSGHVDESCKPIPPAMVLPVVDLTLSGMGLSIHGLSWKSSVDVDKSRDATCDSPFLLPNLH